MLKVCFQAITTGQKIWSRFPAPRQTIREMSGQLGMNAAKIVEVESDGSVFAPYLIGKEVPPEKGYKEVDFLERRMECLTRKEQQVFQEALEMEHPETLEEMVNLSCNLDKFELLEDGKVIRTGEVLDTVYDSEPLPDVGYEKDSVFWLRLDSPFYKRDYGRWYPLSLPADEEKLENLIAAIDELKVKIGIKKTIRDYGIDETDFLTRLDGMVEQAFDDQCTGANPRYPLMSEIKQMYLNAYYGTDETK